ncbi:hypothetical protein [Rhizohabitans arisaemae]|uniref:hypothetical protein n=1 Tax=Rhizohabitans arisaemae TaxID=2720610 RepID=UPI0024B04789|nr:hypothetical protein [Rhizohabitans arisaemae]
MTSKSWDGVFERLVTDEVISRDQAASVRRALDESRLATRIGWPEIIGYVGGGLLLVGTATFIGSALYGLSDIAKIVTMLVLTAGLIAGGWLNVGGFPRPARTGSPIRVRFTGALFALAAVTAAVAAQFLVAEPVYFDGSGAVADYRGLITGVVGLVTALAGYTVIPTVFGVFAAVVFSAFSVSQVIALFPEAPFFVVGLGITAVGAAWVLIALSGILPHRGFGIGAGVLLALLGSQYSVADGVGAWTYALTFLIAVGSLAWFRRERLWALLIGGILGVTASVTQALFDLTDGEIGVALTLMVAGSVLIGTSVVGLRLHRRAEGGRSAGDPEADQAEAAQTLPDDPPVAAEPER